MVQVDVFWAYGLGASLAAAAAPQLVKMEQPFISGFFIKTVLFLSLIWAPTGMLLLLDHPSWETMQAAEDIHSMPSWLVLAFGITNVTQGILGFWVSLKLFKAGKKYLAHLNWVLGYYGMFFILLYGWDGLGYDRFLYDRDAFNHVAWWPGAGMQNGAGIFHFLISSVALTLFIDGVFLIPPLVIMFVGWTEKSFHIQGVRTNLADTFSIGSRYGAGVFTVGLGSAAISAVVVNEVGRLLGVGSHLLRASGQIDANTGMHVLSYLIGLPLSWAILHFTLFKQGRPFYWLLAPLWQPKTSKLATAKASLA